ncbi:GerAB/ArcD/ProY family transporter [Paenibacillus silvisoli]|uniref:GerAB/ArcD/ProY family transporter n=1 Tax=Paenibacillus silvisoli TaxID=3110539 RepID=UPI002805E5FB|nr:endospore germination permease [Paenibacillus silvisoli]
MRQKETVSAFQMSMLFLSYGTGSAIINIPAPLTGAARNGAWISIVLSCIMGMLLLAIVMYMHRRYPDLDFIQYGEKTLGKWLMFLIAIPYLCSIFFMLALIVIDIGTFFNSTMLKETNSDVIRALFFLLAAVTARGGIEVMVRMFVLLLLSTLVFITIVWCMAAPNYHPQFLLPLMPDGIKPILHGTYIAYGFPFAEVSLFAMLLPYVRDKDKKSLHKPMFAALLVNGLTLLISVICTIMAEGSLAGELKYSLYQLARLISIQEIFERVESVIGFSLIILSYMKATIVLYILSKVLTRWAKVRNEQLLIFPVAFVCLLLSFTMYENEPDFVEAVSVIWPLLNNVAFNLPLLLIAAVTLVKRFTLRLRR